MTKKIKVQFTIDESGWGGAETGPKGKWSCPCREGDTCPVCGSKKVSYVSGFMIMASNECKTCGHTCDYCY